MNNKLSRFLVICVSACLPSLASAVDFTGTFQPQMYSDNDIFNGVQLANGTGAVTVTSGAGPTDLNLTFSFNTLSVSVPLIAAGTAAMLAGNTYTFGTTTVLDTHLLSDGNNIVMDYVAQDQSGAISYVVSAWQRNPSFADASTAVGRWVWTSAFGNPNLRDLNGGFHPENLGSGNIVDTGNGYALVTSDNNHLNVPLAIAQGNISLLSAPAPAGTGLWQVLGGTYGQGSGALFFVGTELSDETDVSITLGLVTQAVPEPETRLLMCVGLGFVLAMVYLKRKNSVILAPTSAPT